MTDQTIGPSPTDTKDRRRLWRFLLPSLAGILIFLTPVNVDGNSTIVLGVLTNVIRDLFSSVQLSMIVGVICLSAIGGIYHTFFKPDWEIRFPALYAACHVPPLWLALRVVSAIVGLMLVFNIGPELLRAPDAGPFIYTEAGAAVLYILFVAMFLMPLEIIIRNWTALGWTSAVFLVSMVGLYKYWYLNLPPLPEETPQNVKAEPVSE